MELVVIVASARVLAVRFDNKRKTRKKEVSQCGSGFVARAVGVRLKSLVEYGRDGIISVAPDE